MERIVFLRWIPVFGVACLSCCLGVGDSWGAGQYRVTDLGAFPAGIISWSTASAINESGVVVGSSGDGQGADQPALFSNGSITNLNSLGTFGSGMALGINDRGQVVGNVNVGGNLRAFVYSNGRFTDLSFSLGSRCQANAINASGQVVGIANNNCAYIHDPATRTTVNLGVLPGDDHSYATSINDNGQVVGASCVYVGSRSAYHAFLYSNGTMTSFLREGTLGWASSINASAQVAGWMESSIDGPHRAFVYSSGTTYDLGVLTGWVASEAAGINDRGQVVGTCYDTSGGACAFVYSNGTMQRLDSLLTAASGWRLCSATAINDSGQIVGSGFNALGQTRAFLLTPVPEPSTLTLLGASAVGLLAWVWRGQGTKVVQQPKRQRPSGATRKVSVCVPFEDIAGR
jgi:probable HAF family extracellular repeat protein